MTKNLERVGVVNQTTMLASDTQAIADYFKQIMIDKYQLTKETLIERFADTRDTLCYATNDNQTSVSAMLDTAEAHFAIVVGGYNSSNTSHLVELSEDKLPTYYINNAEKMISKNEILHYNFHVGKEILTTNYLPQENPVKILITSGASCPDALVEKVIERILSFYPDAEKMNDILLD